MRLTLLLLGVLFLSACSGSITGAVTGARESIAEAGDLTLGEVADAIVPSPSTDDPRELGEVQSEQAQAISDLENLQDKIADLEIQAFRRDISDSLKMSYRDEISRLSEIEFGIETDIQNLEATIQSKKKALGLE